MVENFSYLLWVYGDATLVAIKIKAISTVKTVLINSTYLLIKSLTLAEIMNTKDR